MSEATPSPQPLPVQPLAVWNPTGGVWETSQLDLFGRSAPYSATFIVIAIVLGMALVEALLMSPSAGEVIRPMRRAKS